eukprot:scaffold351_cov162-Ochromonas_danica.AAC.21
MLLQELVARRVLDQEGKVVSSIGRRGQRVDGRRLGGRARPQLDVLPRHAVGLRHFLGHCDRHSSKPLGLGGVLLHRDFMESVHRGCLAAQSGKSLANAACSAVK